jgi:hypothetical protein
METGIGATQLMARKCDCRRSAFTAHSADATLAEQNCSSRREDQEQREGVWRANESCSGI